MWQDLTAWIQSPGGARVLQSAIIPALAIVVAAVVATLIARSAVKASVRRADRAETAAAIGTFVAAARFPAGNDLGSQLRAEADVRTRLLPLPGATLAADWAVAHIDALQQRSSGEPASADVDALRDRLIEWTGKPARAKRVFGTPAAPRQAPAREEPRTQQAAAEAEPVAPEPAEPAAAAPDRFARPAPGPRRTPAPDAAPAPTPAVEIVPPEAEEMPAAVAAGTVSAAAAPAPGESVPAWQRTRAVERLQQERTRARVAEPPVVEEDSSSPVSTAPVQVPHAHRAPGAPAADVDEAVRLEAHQQARHARPGEAAPTAGAAPAATPAPAWLDTYDDEAQVTQNLDLKTPPPVAAAAIRDRGGPGEDLVPRS